MENIALVSVKIPYPGQETGGRPNAPRKIEATPLVASPKSKMGQVSKGGSSPEPTVGIKFFAAAMAACAADMVTFPLDTAKVRLQIQGESSGGLAVAAKASLAKKPGSSVAVVGGTLGGKQSKKALRNIGTKATVAARPISTRAKYRGMVGTLCVISQEEGVRALYSGLAAGLQRQMAFGAIRIGLYDAVKQGYINLFQANGLVSSNNVGLRILAGITTGGAAVLCAQPTDVVKVRMQAQGAKGVVRYTGCVNAYRTIAVEEGVRGLWKGTLPNVTRNSVVNATELVSYDLIKESLIRHHVLSDNMPCHFVSAFGAGFCTTVIASPVDVVKTRFMNSGSGVYSGALHCASTMFREGGVRAFYKGFMPSFMRLGAWNIVMFVSYEQLKRGLMKLTSRSHTSTLDAEILATAVNTASQSKRYI